ncbi:toll/interleukin-1 receptor domain-containing protein [Acinetobacter pittii]|uniref:toll/interleukin-1 receptor domain-containing protein n=1 Tax=Acinetobacter pittii TaxID=48296 RepID=UPI0009941E7A|nr:toll/interleukin-1 receptor domain-containing protein [Acinetobacter pittii]OOT50334.1 hypothetical protein BTG92_15435 [Acinetobacter pittii]OTU70751.1 hypothetical protein CAT31_01920 [Acinetobacter pittii]WHA54034.1 hypothetical protein OH685_12315 [Acinetobacter pittii]
MEKGKSKIDMLGYDFFISFTLGPYPRGTQSYASDLARKLREKNFTVFYSEEEAPPGANLSNVLLKALRKSKVLLVIVNEGALLQSTWVKKEVEYFHSQNPKRLIVPINIGNTLEKYGDVIEADNWLNYKNNIWILENELAVETGIANKTVIDRIAVSYHFLKKKNQLIIILTSFISILILLSVFLWINMREAKNQKTTSLLTLYSALQQNGDYKSVLESAKKEKDIPSTTFINSKLGLYEQVDTNNINFDENSGFEDIDEMYYFNSDKGKKIIYQGWYGGIGLIDIGNNFLKNLCNTGYRFLKIILKNNINYYIIYDGDSINVANYNNCNFKTRYLYKNNVNKNSHISAVSLIDDNNFVIGDSVGNVFLHSNKSKKIYTMKPNSEIIYIYVSDSKNKYLIITKKGDVKLINNEGSVIGEAKLQLGGSIKVNVNNNLHNFIKDEWDSKGFFELINEEFANQDQSYIFSSVFYNNKSYLALINFNDTNLFPLAATLDFEGKEKCPWITWVDLEELKKIALVPRCGLLKNDEEQNEVKIELPKIPTNSPGFGDYYTAAAFCGDNNNLIMGNYSGSIAWLRYSKTWNNDHNIGIEHYEQSDKDRVTTIVCDHKNKIYAGFRVSGVKVFKEKFKIEEEFIAENNTFSEVDDYEGLKYWNVRTFYGNSKLELNSENGDITLTQNNNLIWKKSLVSTIPYRTGASTDRIITLTIDEKRGRIWILTSFGRLLLLDLNNGSQITNFVTSYNTSQAALPTSCSALSINNDGGVSFSYKIGESPKTKIKVSLLK